MVLALTLTVIYAVFVTALFTHARHRGLTSAAKATRVARQLADLEADVAHKARSPRRKNWKAYVTGYQFPPQMLDRALERCPAGTDRLLVEEGLRQFLVACGEHSDLAVAMPSKTVDEAWHEFITYTREYAAFCDAAFGRLLHHTPEVTMPTRDLERNHTTGMLRAWEGACRYAGLDPLTTSTAPALFGSDATAGIAGAVSYVADCGHEVCKTKRRVVCVRHTLAPAPAPAAPATIKASGTSGSSKGAGRSSASRRSAGSSSSYYDPTAAIIAGSSASASCDTSSSSSYSSCGSSSSSSSSSCGGGGCGSSC